MKRLTALILLLLALAACSQPQPEPTATPQPTPTPTPQQLLEQAAERFLTWQSAQFRLLRQGEPAVLDPQTGITFSEASGQYQAPDRVGAIVKASLFNTLTELEIRWVPEGAFVTNPLSGQFQALPTDAALDGPALFQSAGIPAALQTALNDTALVGVEEIDGTQALHIRATADGGDLATLTAGTLAAGRAVTVDVYLDQATLDPFRVVITEPDGNGWQLDLFGINEPVEIVAP